MIQHAVNLAANRPRSSSDFSSGRCERHPPEGGSFGTASTRQISLTSAGNTIYREGEPCRAIFQVAHGLARTVKHTSQGRRIIQSFCMPNDIFGMSCTSTYMATAEAVSDLHLMKFEPGQFDSWLHNDGTFARQLCTWLVRNSERVEQLRLLARGTSIEKLSYFLLDLAERMSARTRVELQMSRYDIGDYLGLSSETVSRAFTSLRARGYICTDGHIVYLRNKSGLQQLSMACSTR
ncbi:helix-turn-helix domain-containing protein [Pseudaminobacter sp. 19-2017]|uniref:Helix-turn-helix domain-containing protein n=1 Tax=Pseudaminobacter soli (ex Zhang et al. 2022) TaxID=2831468 RepID=A0A942E355_9HYPH|nr:helix-turn-helix domain-containing protein [Pseudaminobacter soli]MBS3652102.1 helix-turn-helix domain-containing protein [Pseudaminobacter soli]